MKKNIHVTKASGKTETFSTQKLRKSLERAKAPKAQIDDILGKIMPKLYESISTKKIYSEAFRLLRQYSKPSAARYTLKKGIMELGPSGFPFEKFVAKLFEFQGYTTLVGQIVNGKCVTHEIDVIARRNTEIDLVECKYRNIQGISVDVKTPLYIHSRFEDVLANGAFKKKEEVIVGWLITNAKFTNDAVTYARCIDLKLLSWDYPVNESLKDMIDKFGLYPLTCLTSLTKQEKQWLLAHDLVMAKDVYMNRTLLLKAGVSEKRLASVKEEGYELLKPKPHS